MNDDFIKALIKNEEDWRRHLVKQVDEIAKEQKHIREAITTLKVKYRSLAVFFGICEGLVPFLTKFIK